MGSKSGTTANTTTTNTQDIDTTTIGLEDVETGIVGNSGDVTVSTTDFGAVEAGVKLGAQSLDFAGEFGSEALKKSFDFGDEALGTVERGLSASLDFGSDALDTVLQSQKSSEASLGTAFTAVGDALDRVGELSRSDGAAAVKDLGQYAVIGIGILVAGFVLYSIFKK